MNHLTFTFQASVILTPVNMVLALSVRKSVVIHAFVNPIITDQNVTNVRDSTVLVN